MSSVGQTSRLIEAELRSLNETLSFASASSGLMHNSDLYTKGRLPMSARLGQHSQLKTLGARGPGAKDSQLMHMNQLGTTLSNGSLPLDSTGKIAADAEVQLVERTGLIGSAQAQKQAAKAMTQRDTVNIYLHMKADPEFSTVYRENYRYTEEMREAVAHKDRSNIGLFAMDEQRQYLEVAMKYNAWPPKSGIPPWPPKTK